MPSLGASNGPGGSSSVTSLGQREHVLNFRTAGARGGNNDDNGDGIGARVLTHKAHSSTNKKNDYSNPILPTNKKVSSSWSSMLSSVLHPTTSTFTSPPLDNMCSLTSTTSAEQGAQDDVEDEEVDSETESMTQRSLHAADLTSEDCDALLWDAQTALIAHQYQSAVEHLTIAARAGSSTACFSLAKIYLQGLPCVHTKQRASSLSPSRLVEGRIDIDVTKGAIYLIESLQIQSQSEELDLELLSEASGLLCSLYRYGRIRPSHSNIQSAAKIPALPKVPSSAGTLLSSSPSICEKINSHNSQTPNASNLCGSGEAVAITFSLRLEQYFCAQGLLTEDFVTEHTSWRNLSLKSQRKEPYSDNMVIPATPVNIDKLRTILVHCQYIVAICTSLHDTKEGIDYNIAAWRSLLAINMAIQQYFFDARSPTRPRPKRSISLGPVDVEDLIKKAEKRLDILLQAQKQTELAADARHIENNASPLISRSSTAGTGSNGDLAFELPCSPPPVTSPISSLHDFTSEGSIQSLCNCQLSKPLDTPAVDLTRANPPTTKKKRAIFALHDSTTSSRQSSKNPNHLHVAQSSKEMASGSNSNLFRGFAPNGPTLHRKSSLARQGSSTTLGSLHSTVGNSKIAFNHSSGTSYEQWNPSRRQVVRAPSQLSLAATETKQGRAGWYGAPTKPLSRISNLSSASLYTPAPSINLQSKSASVLSLPHLAYQNGQATHSAHLALSSLHTSHRRSPLAHSLPPASTPSSRQGGLSHYTDKVKSTLVSLQNNWFPTSQPLTLAKAEANLRDAARRHDEEVNATFWYADDCSSDAETIESETHNDEDTDFHRFGMIEAPAKQAIPGKQSSLPSSVISVGRAVHNRGLRQSLNRHTSVLSTSIPSSMLIPAASEHRPPAEPRAPPTTPNSVRRGLHTTSPSPPTAKGPVKIDPLLAALEAASRVNVKSRCAVCGIQGVNFPKCHKCDMTFCSRDCRMASGGDVGKHICQRS